jgi:hypothetical protein
MRFDVACVFAFRAFSVFSRCFAARALEGAGRRRNDRNGGADRDFRAAAVAVASAVIAAAVVPFGERREG